MEEIIDDIIIEDEDGKEVVFKVVETTTLGGVEYLLIENEEDGILIIKVINVDGDDLTIEVAEEEEVKVVAKVFEELLDISIEI